MQKQPFCHELFHVQPTCLYCQMNSECTNCKNTISAKLIEMKLQIWYILYKSTVSVCTVALQEVCSVSLRLLGRCCEVERGMQRRMTSQILNLALKLPVNKGCQTGNRKQIIGHKSMSQSSVGVTM